MCSAAMGPVLIGDLLVNAVEKSFATVVTTELAAVVAGAAAPAEAVLAGAIALVEAVVTEAVLAGAIALTEA